MSDYLRAIIIGYIDPVQLNPVNPNSVKYHEGKILWSNKTEAYGFLNGHYCRYKICCYEFHNVPNNELSLIKLVWYVKQNNDKYPGAHHANLYYEKKRKGNNFYKQISL